MKQVLGFIQTTRLIKSLAVGLLLTIVSSSVHYGVGALIFLAFSFVFNDWVDAPKDKISHPGRAIPSKKITHRQAFYIAIVLLILGSGWTIIFLKEYIFGFLIVYSFSVIYSLILKPNIPVLATPVWSVTIAILFLQSFTTETSAYMGVIFLVYAYELILDYRDKEADKKFCRTPTLANMLGKNIYVLAGALFLVGVFFSVQVLVAWNFSIFRIF